jgi:predicted transcriptional regulator
MEKSRAVELAGGVAKLAAILGISPQAVSKWPDERIPELQMYRLREKKRRWFRAEKAPHR